MTRERLLSFFVGAISATVLWSSRWPLDGAERKVGSGVFGCREGSHTPPLSSALALRESLGFFKDVNDGAWEMKKRKYRDMVARQGLWGRFSSPARSWYQNNWEPNFACGDEERLGPLGDGGKWVCDPERVFGDRGLDAANKQKASDTQGTDKTILVYSIGSNNNWGFEEFVRERFGANTEVHTFDHTIDGNVHGKPEFVQYHPWGLGAKTDAAKKLYTIDDMRKMIKSSKHNAWSADATIEILKIDCEKCEWEVYPEIFGSGARQILIELHGGTRSAALESKGIYAPKRINFPRTAEERRDYHDNTLGKLPAAEILPAERLFEKAREEGYVITHKEPNTMGCGGTCIEYAFLKLGPEFFAP